MADDRNDAAGYLGWFFLGGVVGAATALLLAPRTGRETRELLADRIGGRLHTVDLAGVPVDLGGSWIHHPTGNPLTQFADKHQLARRAQELANDAQGRAGEWMDKSRELFEEQTQRLMTAFEAGRDAMRDEMRKDPTAPRG